MRIEEIANYTFLFVSMAIIVYETIFMHKIVVQILSSDLVSDNKFRQKKFAIFVLISIFAICTILASCIGKPGDILHISVPIISFSNIGMLVWADRYSVA